MAFGTLLFRKGNFLGEIKLDIIITESASSTSRITKNPVENGADMNDHIIIEPMSFKMTAVVSNSISNILDLPTALDRTKAQSAWNDLLELQMNREPFTLVQGLKTYDNIVIQSLTETQDKDTSKGLFFTATLTEIIVASTDGAPVTGFLTDDISDQMVPSTNGGLTTMGVV